MMRDRTIGVMHDHMRDMAPVLKYKAPEANAFVCCSSCMSVVFARKRAYFDCTDDGAWVLHKHQPGKIAYEVAGDLMADGGERAGKKRTHR